MPHIIETTAYKFDELDDSAKEKARDGYRQFVFSDNNDWDFIYEDADRMAKLMGIEISTSPVKLMNGKFREKLDIYFSGFCSQGDGACFEGHYAYQKGAVKAITAECGGSDKTLIEIATGLQRVQRRNFYRLGATVTHRDRYYHAYSADIETYRSDDVDVSSDDHDDVVQLLREFMDWIYSQLEAAYEYQISDEAVDESIIANEYDFEENGARI